MPTFHIDAAIIGGGVAGTWALNLLQARGYNVVLLEADALGCEQTLASQGLIHGGLKYALAGKLTGASEAIAEMPDRWRRCLAGDDNVDLSRTRVLSQRYFMFAEQSARGRFTSFVASKSLRGRIEKLARQDWPEEFHGFIGVLYELNDFVLDTNSLLENLVHNLAHRVLAFEATAANVNRAGEGFKVTLADCDLQADQLISCAGNGSEALMKALGISGIPTQQRPLKQVVVRPKHSARLYGHCLTGVSSAEPRITITSHQTEQGLTCYLGGKLATEGVRRSDDEQIAFAKQELAECVPWLDWQDAEYEVATINRAEPYQGSGLKPDNAFVASENGFIACFPTKLTLAPDLGDRLLKLMPPPTPSEPFQTNHPRAQIGQPPW